jgi:hypothetical protein
MNKCKVVERGPEIDKVEKPKKLKTMWKNSKFLDV